MFTSSTQKHTRTHTYTFTYARTQIHTHTHTYMHIHARTYTRTHTHKHTHSCTHVHTHAPTHKFPHVRCLCWGGRGGGRSTVAVHICRRWLATVDIARWVHCTLLGTITAMILCYSLVRAFHYPPPEDARSYQRGPAHCPRAHVARARESALTHSLTHSRTHSYPIHTHNCRIINNNQNFLFNILTFV